MAGGIPLLNCMVFANPRGPCLLCRLSSLEVKARFVVHYGADAVMHKVFCWNVGGLTTIWDELLLFLESQGVDIAILSETM